MNILSKFMFAACLFPFVSACGGTSSGQQNVDNNGMPENQENAVQENIAETGIAKLLYMGHGSLRITTAEGKVIYIDPFVGDEKMYSPSADLILLTHKHFDHVQTDKIKKRNEDCQIITWKEALKDGKHQSFDLGYAKIEAVEAGYNKNHDVKECVGYIITLSDGKSVYVSGDTSTTKQMPQLAKKNIDYAFFCADGTYNMDLDEAAECARLVKAKHNIPYHIISKQGVFFDRSRAEQFNAPDRLIIDEGEEIEVK